MQAVPLRDELLAYVEAQRHVLATDSGEWVAKGVVDLYRNIYPITADTKLLSKIIELMLLTIISRYATEHNYAMILSRHQNHYPDVTLITAQGTKIALDLKSTYRTGPNTVNGMTLGAFTGYFRQRGSSKNTTFPYREFAQHLVLGVIYSRQDNAADAQRVFTLEELPGIVSVVKDFAFLLHEKWRIAGDQPGSGNTKNIGSAHAIVNLLNGSGPFAVYGEATFDDYWMNYLTMDMARAIDSVPPYRSLSEYFAWKLRGFPTP